jgi:hypothetical protein
MKADVEVLLCPGISIPSIRSSFCTIRHAELPTLRVRSLSGVLVMSFRSTFVIAESLSLRSSLVGTVYHSTNGAVSTKACCGSKG